MGNYKFKRDDNLTITSDMELFDISYRKDQFFFKSIENESSFINSTVKMCHKTPDYKNFVDAVRELKMDHCQVLGNISRFDATLEMHHGPMLTIYDYCDIVTSYLLQTVGWVTEAQVAKIVMKEHYEDHVQVVMLCKTAHEMLDSGEIFINLNQGIGNVNGFLQKYKIGLDGILINKINKYIDLSKEFQSHDSKIFELEKTMVNWSYRELPSGIGLGNYASHLGGIKQDE